MFLVLCIYVCFFYRAQSLSKDLELSPYVIFNSSVPQWGDNAGTLIFKNSDQNISDCILWCREVFFCNAVLVNSTGCYYISCTSDEACSPAADLNSTDSFLINVRSVSENGAFLPLYGSECNESVPCFPNAQCKQKVIGLNRAYNVCVCNRDYIRIGDTCRSYTYSARVCTLYSDDCGRNEECVVKNSRSRIGTCQCLSDFRRDKRSGICLKDKTHSNAKPVLPNSMLPVAVAGSDVHIEWPMQTSAVLNASASLLDSETKVEWFQLSGPNAAAIRNAKLLETAVSNLIPGEYVFRLKLSGKAGATRDSVKVIVMNSQLEVNVTVNASFAFITRSISAIASSTSLFTPTGWRLKSSSPGLGFLRIHPDTRQSSVVGLVPGMYSIVFMYEDSYNRKKSVVTNFHFRTDVGKKIVKLLFYNRRGGFVFSREEFRFYVSHLTDLAASNLTFVHTASNDAFDKFVIFFDIYNSDEQARCRNLERLISVISSDNNAKRIGNFSLTSVSFCNDYISCSTFKSYGISKLDLDFSTIKLLNVQSYRNFCYIFAAFLVISSFSVLIISRSWPICASYLQKSQRVARRGYFRLSDDGDTVPLNKSKLDEDYNAEDTILRTADICDCLSRSDCANNIRT